MAEETQGAEATPEGSGAAVTPEGQEGGEQQQRGGSHFSDAYADEATRKLAGRYNTEEEMATALRSANTEISTRIKTPGADASDEDLSKFRKQMGVPDDIAGYAVQRPEHLPEEHYNSAPVQETITEIVSQMHKAGASKAVVDATLDSYWRLDAAGKDAQGKADADAMSAADAALRTDWGPNYDANMAFAKQTADQYPDLAQLELKDGTLLGSSPHMANLMATHGRQNSEGTLHAGLINTEAGVDLKSEYDRLTSEISTAYNSGDKMAAQRLDTERANLSSKLHGNRPISGQQM